MIAEAVAPQQDAILLVQLADRRYGLPLAMVERVLPMAAVLALPESSQGVIGVLNLRGDILPVVDPRPRLGLPTPRMQAEQSLVLVSGSTRYLLWVDAIEEVLPASDAQTTVPAQQASSLVPRVIRLGESLVPVLSATVLEPRGGTAR